MKNNKILPVETQGSAALSILGLPEANTFIDKFNKDLNFENEKIVQMVRKLHVSYLVFHFHSNAIAFGYRIMSSRCTPMRRTKRYGSQ